MWSTQHLGDDGDLSAEGVACAIEGITVTD